MAPFFADAFQAFAARGCRARAGCGNKSRFGGSATARVTLRAVVGAGGLLLLPVDWSVPDAPVRVEPPAERTLILSAQRGPSVVRTDELTRRQETVLTGENDTSPLPADPPVTFEEAYGTAPDNSAKNIPLTGLLFLLWASGMTGYITLQIVKYKRFCRLVRRWRHETTRSDYARLLADECAALGVKQPRLLLCEAVGTPMMTGLFILFCFCRTRTTSPPRCASSCATSSAISSGTTLPISSC